MWEAADSFTKKFQQALLSQYHLIYTLTWEESRLEQMLRSVSQAHYKDDRPIITWSVARGFHAGREPSENIRDPEAALQHIATGQSDAIYLMKDLPALTENNEVLQRLLRDLDQHLGRQNTFVVMSYPLLKIPEVLKKEVYLIELGLPGAREFRDALQQIKVVRDQQDKLGDSWISQCASSMRGLTLNEARRLTLRLAAENKLGTDAAIEDIHDQKAQIILKETCLRLIPFRPSVSTIGGLENLKGWVQARGKLFTKEAYDAGIPLPSGVLFMGVSGCGKSLAAKAISQAWKLPLIRLDMNLIFSGVYGPPEYAFDRACRIAEAVAPVVLWIDEIENAFGYDEGPSTGGNVNIFSSFLTWMQEKPASVFVAATANRIHKLPAEMIRKGRFDQLFFLDLPTEKEREAIFRIHIENNGGNIEDFDLGVVAAVTRERTGAEIEQIVKGARVQAFTEGRAFTQRDISQSSNQIVPLSTTMHEQIKQLRDWSHNRAAPASKKEG